MKTMSATIQIDAPPMTVWAVLTDLDSYPDWNPLFREASGQVAVGSRITLRSVHPANGRLMTVKPKITVADPGAELRWTSSLPPLISGEHSFTLTGPRRDPAGASGDVQRPPGAAFRQDVRPRRDQLPRPQRGYQEAGRSQLTLAAAAKASCQTG